MWLNKTASCSYEMNHEAHVQNLLSNQVGIAECVNKIDALTITVGNRIGPRQLCANWGRPQGPNWGTHILRRS